MLAWTAPEVFLMLIKGSVSIINLMLFNRIKELNAFSDFAGAIGGSHKTKERHDTFC